MRERNIRILFRLSDKEAEAFDALVKQSGLTRAAYLRCLINGLIPIELPPPDYYTFARELNSIGNNLNQIAVKAHVLGVIDAKRYDETARELEEVTKEITKAVYRHKEMDRWQPPQSGV